MTRVVYAQEWEESELGWGTSHDGYSLHPSPDVALKYIQAHWDKQPKGYVPEFYSRNVGVPKPVEVSDELAEKVLSAENQTVRHYGRKPSDI